MTDVLAVCDALRDTLKGVEKLSVGIALTGSLNPPYAFVGVPTIESYRRAFAGARMDIVVSLTILTSTAMDEVGTRRLIEFSAPAGDRSIFERIEKNNTLGGVVERAEVVDFRPLGPEEVGAIGYFGGEFSIRIMARGD